MKKFTEKEFLEAVNSPTGPNRHTNEFRSVSDFVGFAILSSILILAIGIILAWLDS